MEIKIGNVVLNEQTVNTPFKVSAKGAVNTKPLSGDSRNSETQEGVQPITLTVAFSVPHGMGDVIEAIEELRQENEDVSI